MFDGSTCLVAGASGFLGGAIAQGLLSRGASVRAIRLTKEPTFHHPKAIWDRADLRDPAECARVSKGADFFVICSASTAGAKVIRETPMANVTPNVIMNTYLLEAAHAAGVRRTLFLSSGAAYPTLDGHPLREDDMFKDDPPDVYFHPGWMKRYGEILCQTYAERVREPMPCTVVRPANVYGPGDKFDWDRSHVTAAQIRRVIERQAPITIWGTGQDERDLIYVDDFVTGTLAAFAVPDAFFAVNICSGTTHSVREIVTTAAEVDGYTNAEFVYDTSKPSTIAKRVFDPGLAKDRLGFAAKTNLRDGLAQTIKWYRTTHGK